MRGHDLLKIFPDFTVCSGHKGLYKNISTITVMDAPDIYIWMKGDEFLITSGYIFKNSPEKFANLIFKLKEKNITALGIKVNRFIKQLPDIVLKTSNELDLPIINIPDHYAFSDIINPGLTTLVNSQYKELLISEKIHNEFIRMGIYNTEIHNVLERLYSFIKKDIVYLDILDNKLYTTSTSFKDYIIESGINNINSSNIYIHPVKNDFKLHGYIVINCNKIELNTLNLRTVEYAQTMIILHIQKELSNKQILKSYKDNFILDLLLNNIKSDEEIINRANIYNWNLSPNMFCMVIDIDDFKLNYKTQYYGIDTEKIRDLVFEDVDKSMKTINKDSYYMTKSDSMVYIINYNDRDLQEFENSLIEMNNIIKEKYGYSLTIAFGNRYENIRDIYKSYKECLICLKTTNILNISENKIIKYNDISIYWNLLNSLKDNNYKDDPLVSKIKDLIKFDNIHKTEYFDSIKCIVENDWNLKKTSKKMFIHYNTMKYRYIKIKELLDDNLDSRPSKLKLELGLYLFEIEH